MFVRRPEYDLAKKLIRRQRLRLYAILLVYQAVIIWVDMEKGMGLIAGKLYYTQSHDSNHIVPFGYPCHRNDRDMCLYLGIFSDLSGAAWPGCDFLQPTCQIYRAFLLVRHGSDPGTASEKLPAHFIGRHLHAFF